MQNKDGKKQSSFNTWAVVTKFFAQSAKNINFEDEIKIESEGDVLHYTGIFSEDIFRECSDRQCIGTVADISNNRNYKKAVVEDEISVDFEYINPEIERLLQQFENGWISEADRYKSLKFIPMNGGLKIENRLVQQARIVFDGETETHRKVKLSFCRNFYRGDI